MTAQVTEILIVDGEELAMCSEPLSGFFNIVGISSPFKSQCTDCWRGYYGVWAIEENNLYLKSVTGRNARGEEISLPNLFPGNPDRVFARWYSGEIHCTSGKLLEYAHMGYQSIYEIDRFFSVQEGAVIGERTVNNELLQIADAVPKSKNRLGVFIKNWRGHGTIF